MRVRSPCIFCGSACLLEYIVEKGRIKAVLPVKEDPVSEGKPCIKGLSIHEISPRRVLQPMVREGEELVVVSWEYALDLIVEKIENTAPSKTGWIGSGEITNEDNYVIQKFAREVVGSENVDTCARLCHSPTMKAYKEMLGVPCSPHFENDIYGLDAILLVGTNPAATYPTIFSKILASNAKILVINSWENETTDRAELKAIVRPGTMVFFVAGIVRGLIFEKGVEFDVEGFEKLKKSVEPYDEKVVAKITGEKKETLRGFVDLIYESKSFGVQHGMKYTQTYHGTDAVRILTALAVLKNAKILTMRGKVNIQGAGDVGCVPGALTLTDFLLLDPVDFVYCSIFNPARSMPALEEIWQNLRRMFLVHATPYYNATTDFADVVLPTPFLYEREGTITNGERRVRYVRKVVDPPGSAKQDWEILTGLAGKMGVYFGYKSPKDVFYDIVNFVPDYSHIDPEVVYSGEDVFARKAVAKKKLFPFSGFVYEFPGYPYRLITVRRLPHFNTGDLTTRSKTLQRVLEKNKAWFNPKDARKEGISPGDFVKIISPQGEITVEVDVSKRVPSGVIMTTFHFEDSPVNILIPKIFDKEVKIPMYKTVPVRVEKCGD